MLRLALLLTCLAAPAAAQAVQGTCRDGSLWWASDGSAGLAPCESPGEGFFTLTCAGGDTTMRFVSPYPVAVGQRGTADLTIDGQDWRLEGTGEDDAATGLRILSDIAVPATVLDALASGSSARLDGPAETRPFHLSGSGAAIAALRDTCGDAE
ncbi:hypothetical protein [Jannaschia formosa]|uniref:hypothetical protein n=1 Tax=Jannaschia formosa TaxID=2259592 RepID=UPI000E1C3F62|nr:hypothetical protein [Jannaschia formosa]TFL19953.1 hypothetical protein DR046_00990 [Jannaschia formosa]